jgi:hypothetical protein
LSTLASLQAPELEAAVNYPRETQSALLFDQPFQHLEEVANKVVAVLSNRYETPFRISETNPGHFYRIFGGNEVMITLEYMPDRANMALLELPLKSPITTLLCPDVPARIDAHQTCVLISVMHGVSGNSPEIAAMLEQVHHPTAGATLAHFQQRLELSELVIMIAQESQPASAIHWMQSDQLFDAKTFETLGGGPAPNHLHVHPFLMDSGKSEQGKPLVSVVGLGSSQFVGRTVMMRPSTLPWQASFEALFVFLRVALKPNGYIIPDTETFGDEDNSQSYRVRHIEAQDGSAALYELETLLHRAHGYKAVNYIDPHEGTFDPPKKSDDFLPAASEDHDEVIEAEAGKPALAESKGGRFDVRRAVGGRMVAPPETPKAKGFLGRIKRFAQK